MGLYSIRDNTMRRNKIDDLYFLVGRDLNRKSIYHLFITFSAEQMLINIVAAMILTKTQYTRKCDPVINDTFSHSNKIDFRS